MNARRSWAGIGGWPLEPEAARAGRPAVPTALTIETHIDPVEVEPTEVLSKLHGLLLVPSHNPQVPILGAIDSMAEVVTSSTQARGTSPANPIEVSARVVLDEDVFLHFSP